MLKRLGGEEPEERVVHEPRDRPGEVRVVAVHVLLRDLLEDLDRQDRGHDQGREEHVGVRVALDGESRLLEHPAQPRARVAPVVLRDAVVVRVEELVRRDAHEHVSTGPQHALHLAHRAVVVLDVLDRVEHAHEVEGAVRVGSA
ncbi:MAG: hypothetical protein R3F34_18105 [Planctomycetota bacterium]